MNKILFIFLLLSFVTIGNAQIILPSMRVFNVITPNPTYIYFGGLGSSAQNGLLQQSNCSTVFANNMFLGGLGSSAANGLLQQSTCN